MFERMQYGIACGASQTTVRTGLQHLIQMLDFAQVIFSAMPIGNFVHGLFEHRGADTARCAETATFMREEMHKVSCHFKHVAAVIEYHECTGGRQILEAQFAIEFTFGDTYSGWPADLHSTRIYRAAVLQYFAYRHPERVFVDSGTWAIAGD